MLSGLIKRTLILVFDTLLCLLPIMFFNTDVSASGGYEASEWINNDARSVVRLEVYNGKDERIGTGSGFAMKASEAQGEPVILVTARHVIKNCSYMIAWRDDESSFQVSHIIDADEDADVAICELPEDANLDPLPIAKEDPVRGDAIYVIGSQFGLTNLASDGILSGRWESGETDWLIFTAPVSGGCSGGPVFNNKGEVIGVVMGTYEKAQNLNLAAPIERAVQLFDIG